MMGRAQNRWSTLLISDALDTNHQHINDQQQHSNQHFVSNLIANPNLSKISLSYPIVYFHFLHCNTVQLYCVL